MAERAQPPKAQDKLAFLLSLVPYLMDHDRVSVTEAAAHFGVPAEQIRDAVRLIAVSGIPGETASYQHGDLFDIAWDDFTEALPAFLDRYTLHDSYWIGLYAEPGRCATLLLRPNRPRYSSSAP